MKTKRWVTGAALAITFGAPAAAQAADTLYGVTAADELVSFSSDAPGNVAVPLAITGLQAGETVEGIDVRPATGEIYALGSTGRVYVIDPRTATATPAFSRVITLRGDDYGIDFNPTVDKLRLVSDGEDNQRLNPDTGANVLNTDTNTPVDGDITPAGDVVAAAYTNNVNGRQAGSATQLYTIDAGTDTLNLQAPPNNGTQTAVGPLGVDVTAAASFDVPAAANVGYAALEVGGTTGLYTIDLATGAATLVGPIATSSPLTGLTAAKQDTPLHGLTAPVAGVQRLLTFGSSAPRDTNAPQGIPVLAARNITGAPNLVGIDTRPADGGLYGFTVEGDTYRIDIASGQATRTAVARVPVDAAATTFGVDFNPVPNRLRVVDDADQNFRINPDDATAAGITADGAINPEGTLVAAAYTNAFPGTTATTLYTVDGASDVLNRQDPPNAGTQVPLAPLGIDVGAETGYDIAAQDNAGFLVAQNGAATRSTLYRLESGIATSPLAGTTPIGAIGADATGFVVRGVTAASPGALGVAATTATAAESAGTVRVAVARSSAVGTATVNYVVAPGTASADEVAAATGAVTFNPGETIKSVPVVLTDDATDEGSETATVTLSRAAGGYRLGEVTTTLTITDDDDAPATPPTTVTTPAPPPTTVTTPAPPAVTTPGGTITLPGGTVTIPGTTVTVPAPAPGLVPDRGRPVVLVYAPDRRLRTLRASGVPVVVSTNEAGRIDLTLRLGDRVLGTRTVVATGPTVVRQAVTLTAAGRRAVGTSRTRRLTATAVVTDVAGNVTTQRTTFRGTRSR